VKKSQLLADSEKHADPLSRRKFLEVSTASGVALATVVGGAPLPAAAQQSGGGSRAEAALQLRREAAQAHFAETETTMPTNGDEKRYADRRGNFAKSLPHDDLGNVDPKAYDEFVSILMSADPARFETFPRDPKCNSKLSSPLSAYAYDLVGADAQAVALPAPPAFASAEQAFEAGEIFWQLLTLDIPFRDYESDPLIAAAAADLNVFSAKLAPRSSGKVTPAIIFRGESAGDLVGPYISQFFWMDIPYGVKTIDQRYRAPKRGQAFLTTVEEWVANQRGMRGATRGEFESAPRYIINNRDLAEWVHGDFNFQAALNAVLIIQRWGDEAQASGNPYLASKTQAGGVTLGREALNLLGLVCTSAQKSTYFHKWLTHRRLRPDAFMGKLDHHMNKRASYDIHDDLLSCDGMKQSQARHGTCLLPAAYPEGSPMHPAYPAGHATNAGATITLLKAFFNENFHIPNPVVPSADGSKLEPYTGAPLTIGTELNKMAHNVSLGRDAGGVHWRSDGIQGMYLGEQMTIAVLCDYSRTYRERFGGYELTRFNGRKIRIANGKVANI
jgi:hypothetical protein